MRLLLALVALCVAVDHVHLIDSSGRNMLFRGGSPEVNKSFSYSSLVAAMQVAAKTTNATFPAKFQVVVINVENLDTTWDSFTSEGRDRRFCLFCFAF